MSEFQSYEFLAVDRRLTAEEMAALRRFSTRARITPTSFANTYEWGDLKGDPLRWMEKYFDVFGYWANWGTRRLMVRIPAGDLAPETAEPYLSPQSTGVHRLGPHAIVEITCSGEERDEYFPSDVRAGDEVGAPLDAIAEAREALAAGDLTLLYLGWLVDAADGFLDEDELEPPVPAGLGAKHPWLPALAEFLDVDDDLLAVAAAGAPASADSTPADPRAWVAAVAAEEKDAVLARIAAGDLAAAREWQALWRRACRTAPAGTGPRRTVGELLESAEQRRAERIAEAKRAAALKAEREALEKARLREAHIQSLAGREDELWAEVERILTGEKRQYDAAMALLTDLRDMDARWPSRRFAERLAELCVRHARKGALIRRIREAELE